jgi:iron(III) transport system permease protein
VVSVLLLFVLYPLARVCLTPRLGDWAAVLSSPRWRGALANTLFITVLSTLSSVTLGYAYAYAVTKARIPGAAFFSALPLLLLVSPPFVGGLAFTFLFGRRGLITHALLGFDLSIYGWQGLWLAQTLAFFPTAYIILRSSLGGQNCGLDQAARGLGASRLKVFSSITLPLSRPGLLSASLYISISVLSDFANPLLVGGRFRVLATEIYTQLSGWANPGASACVGVMLLVPALLLFSAQRGLERRGPGRFATQGGRGSSLPGVGASLAARALLFGLCLLAALYIVLHFGIIFWGALSRVWGVDPSLSFTHIRRVAREWPSLANSLSFAVIAALCSALVSSLAAYVSRRCRAPLSGAIDALTLLPAAIPGSLIGLSFVLAFNGAPFRLTGTALIIVAAMAIRYLPMGYRVNAAALGQIKESMDDGARALGASRSRVFLDIIAPMTREPIISTFVFAFVQAMGSLSAVIFLVSFHTPLASVSILNWADQGSWGDAAALASLLILLTFGALGAGRLLAGKRFTQGLYR